jgi:tetratricopeptide (TPR) repeat protein
LHQLHAVPEQFVGREQEIAAILKQILDLPAHGPAAISAICSVDGLPGVGKTELANRAAQALAPHFPDAQLFVPLAAHSSAPWTPQRAMEFCLTSFYPDASPPTDDAPLGAAYLSAFHGRRCLLLLDDARDYDHIKPLLPPPGCALLVTSRARLPCSHLDSLDTLPPAEAAGLLRRLCPRLSEAQAGKLAELCGCLPIALCVAGGHLNRNRSAPVEEFTQKLSGPERLKNLKLGQLDVQAVFEASYAALAPEQQAGFRALAAMTVGFDREAALAVVGGETEGAATILDELAGRNLVSYDDNAKRFRWHDLLREFACNQAKADELDAAKRRHADHFIRVADRAGGLYEKGGKNVRAALKLFDTERLHLEAAFDWLKSRRDRESAALLVSLVDTVAYTGSLRFHPRERVSWREAQVRAARLTEDRSGEETALNSLGLAYTELGNARKAIEFHKQSLDIAREIGDRGGEGAALNNLGMAHGDLGHTRKAIEFYEQALVIAREIPDPRGESDVLGDVGLAYANLGDAHKAIECHERALEIARKIGDRRGEGQDLCNLGSAYRDLGEAHKAIEFYEKARDVAQEIDDRPTKGIALGNLGLAYSDLHDTHKAIGLYEESRVIAHEIGDRHGEANTLGNLSLAYVSLHDVRRAIELCEQHLTMVREIGDRRGEGTALDNFGLAYADSGDARKAVEWYDQALGIFREVNDRRGEGNTLWNSAQARDKLGDRAQAIARAEAALRILETIKSPNTAEVRSTLAGWRKAEAGS